MPRGFAGKQFRTIVPRIIGLVAYRKGYREIDLGDNEFFMTFPAARSTQSMDFWIGTFSNGALP